MKHEGPYREPAEIKENINWLREEINKENKIGIQIPEDIKEDDPIEGLIALIEYGFKKQADKAEYKDIILYSEDLGILHFVGTSKHPTNEYRDLLYWQNGDGTIELTASLDDVRERVTLFAISKNIPKK